MKNSLRYTLTVTVLALAAVSTAFAGPADHNDGFFLRLQGGGGYASTSISDPSSLELKLSGIGGDFNAAIGAVVKPNLAIHGNVWGWIVSSPNATINGIDAGSLGGSLSMGALGGGATYYFMPVNMYLTGAIGMAQLSTNGGSSDMGFVVDLGVGKEWWVSPKWGLGVNAGLNYHSVPDGGVSENWSGATFVFGLSATLN